MTDENEAPEYERKGSLATYNLMDALKRNPLLIQAGADICAEAISTIIAKDKRIAELEAKLHRAKRGLKFIACDDSPEGKHARATLKEIQEGKEVE